MEILQIKKNWTAKNVNSKMTLPVQSPCIKTLAKPKVMKDSRSTVTRVTKPAPIRETRYSFADVEPCKKENERPVVCDLAYGNDLVVIQKFDVREIGTPRVIGIVRSLQPCLK